MTTPSALPIVSIIKPISGELSTTLDPTSLAHYIPKLEVIVISVSIPDKNRLLKASFYERSCFSVARELLGSIIVSNIEGSQTTGRIVEVEPYIGAYDRASHAWPMKRTSRTEAMFGPGGRAYIFLVYGMHHQLCAVTGAVGSPDAVLIRAVEPLHGLDIMTRRRAGKPLLRLCDGPGKLCSAMAVTSQLYGVDLTDPASPLYIEKGDPIGDEEVLAAPRVGLSYAGVYAQVPWRMYLKDCPWVSVKNKAAIPYGSLPDHALGPQSEI